MAMKPYVVFVPQIVTGGHRPYWFDTRVFAESFAAATSGAVCSTQAHKHRLDEIARMGEGFAE